MPRTVQKIMTGWEFTLNKPVDGNFRQVNLPHDWAVSAAFDQNMDQGEQQGFRDRWGIGWYRKTLHLKEKKAGYCYYLEFGGIFENSTIWINGQEAGGQLYGYSTFRLDVTRFVETGENRILVKVDNTVSPVDRWYSGCGIYRTVKWIQVEEKHLDPWEIVVTTRLEGSEGVVAIDVGMEAAVNCVLRERTGTDVCEADRYVSDESARRCQTREAYSNSGKMEIRVPDARLWDTDTPNLYELVISLMDGERTADTVSMCIGIREYSMTPDQGFRVNGKKVILKGVCLHQDAGCVGIAVARTVMRDRLKKLKDMGCNSIRAAHHTHSEEFLDLCDEMGFFVYEECFDKWTGGLYGRYFQTQWKADVDAMVKRDRNRPCIFIWGVGNEVENQGQKSMLDILKMLKEYVCSLDSTRPVTYAMNPHFKRESRVDITQVEDIQQFVDEVDDTEIYDPVERVERIALIAGIVDVISCNYQEQWYPLIHKYIPDKLILGTEVYQFFQGHMDQMQNFTNSNPNLVPRLYDYCMGSMVWTGYDYLGESMGYPAKGWSGAPLYTNGETRPSYYILQSYWSEEPMVHFSVMDYSLGDEGVKEHWDIPIYVDHWHFPQFHKTVIPYMIASNCEEVALFLNGRRFYLPEAEQCPGRLVTGFLPYYPGKVEAVGYRNGVEVCRHVTVTPGPAVKLDFDQKLIQLNGVDQEPEEREAIELLLTVRARDEDGNPYFRESARVWFRIEGDGDITAVDNGDIKGSEPYQADNIHMYRGCASVMIRIKWKGRIKVLAFADGMQSGQALVIMV